MITPAESEALAASLLVALCTVALCTPPAVGLAWWMAQARWHGKWVLDTLILLPMALPPVVVGLALAGSLGEQGTLGEWVRAQTGQRLPFYPGGAVLAASLMTLPLMVRVMRPAFEAADAMLTPVARTLGASAWQAWWTVTLPGAWHAVLSASALGLAAAWGETGATLALAAAWQQGPTPPPSTAPLVLLSSLHDGHGAASTGHHLAWVSLGVALGAMLLSEWGRTRWHRLAGLQAGIRHRAR